MAKLFVIGVGGTGSRVMHSLMMLLASGMKINASEVIPMIIDTDVNNGNLNDFKDLARNYSNIHDNAKASENHFFHTKVRVPQDLSIDGRQVETLEKMINYNGLINQNTKSFIDLLFSKDNLQMPLEKGFVGNPNIGAIVLNDMITNSDNFVNFTQEFAEGDRIFIISSIFGGTGAAGFPLLLKNFRHNDSIDKASIIRDAIIGAVTVLPYFAVSRREDEADAELEKYDVDSNTFILKTKAALSYYDKYVSDDVNGLYFIGDYKRSTYKSQKGGEKQKNKSNLIEVAAALSVIDFMNLEPEKSKQSEMRHTQNFYEFSVKEDRDQVDFSTLHHESSFTKPLIKYHIFRQYFTEFLLKSLGNKNLKWKVELEMDKNYYNSDNGLSSELKNFFNSYDIWINDLGFGQHGRKYIPFKNEKATEKNLLSLFNGKQPKMKKSILGNESIPAVDTNNFFNDVDILKSGTVDQKFMHLMNEGIDAIYNKYFQN